MVKKTPRKRTDLKLHQKHWVHSYPVKDWRDGIVRQKTTIYHLAELITETNVTLSEEHTELSWAGADETKKLIPKFEDLQAAIDEAQLFINKL